MARALYQLTPRDVEIFNLSKQLGSTELNGEVVPTGASWFSSYYIRTKDQPSGWEFDHQITPPWQLDYTHETRTDLVVVAGMGSGKTITVGMAAFFWACMLPNFKFLNVAPAGGQANQMFETLRDNLLGTIAQERFVWKMVEAPWPKIEIRYLNEHGVQHRSILEFMSAADNADRIKNYEGDWVNIDQAEMMPDLPEAMTRLGTRTRGTIKGRPRMGRISLLANSEDNPDLDFIYDQAEEFPDTNRSWRISTYSNGNVTPEQMKAFERRLGNDPEKIAQHMKAEKVGLKGDEFTEELIKAATNEELDDLMAMGLQREDPGYVLETAPKAGPVLWQMPPQEGRVYLVVGDPGQSAAPLRNSPVVYVFDITDYPAGQITLQAMWWGNGGGKYGPWVNRMTTWIAEYHAISAAYDSTSGQKVHGEYSFVGIGNIFGVDMGGSKKAAFLTTLKLIMAQGLLGLPKIKGIRYQLAKYKTPDTKITQDLVAALLVMAGALWIMGLQVPGSEPSDDDAEDDSGRDFSRSRYSRPRRDRNSRATARVPRR
jgi:hypothetical protein